LCLSLSEEYKNPSPHNSRKPLCYKEFGKQKVGNKKSCMHDQKDHTK